MTAVSSQWNGLASDIAILAKEDTDTDEPIEMPFGGGAWGLSSNTLLICLICSCPNSD